jgi:uncharacterized membrane protein YqgA involved in biofilm formation
MSLSMWQVLNGTVVNTATVAVGSAAGLALGSKLPHRYQRIILDCLGLITVTLAIDASVLGMSNTVAKYGAGIPTYGARLGMAMVACLIIGSIFGTALRLHARLEGLGEAIHRRMPASDADPSTTAKSFAVGFLTASVIFCVGPLTLLGCLQNGSRGDPSLLYIKSCLDGFCSMALAASMGLGVAFSLITIIVFQGGLALTAYFVAGGIPDLSVQLMNIVGGVILMATALMILEIKKTPVADMLPAVFLAPLAVWVVEHWWAGTLLPTIP